MRGSIGKCGARVAGAGEVASDWWPNGNGCSGCLKIKQGFELRNW